jgi:protease I
MKKIAVLIADMFEDSEYEEPVRAFLDSGHRVVTVGLKEGATVTGKTHQSRVIVERAVSGLSPGDFDALFIPGGYSPDKLRADPDVVAFVREFVLSGKPVLGICHAPQLLISARVLSGRRITGYISIVQDIKNAGAEFVDREVVRDKNLVFSRNPHDLPAFIRASLEMLEESESRP